MAERRVIMKELLKSFWTDESGQGLTEYALIIALVAIGLFAVLIIFRNQIGLIFDNISGKLKDAPTDDYIPTVTG
jgi:pilus assembly protein Flp/PilA